MSNACAFVLREDELSNDRTAPSSVRILSDEVESSWDRKKRWPFSSWSPTAKIVSGVGVVTLLAVLGAVACFDGRRSSTYVRRDGNFNRNRSNGSPPSGFVAGWITEVQGASLGGFFLDWTSKDLPDGFRCLVAFAYRSDYSFFLNSGSHRDYGNYDTVGVCPGGCQDPADDASTAYFLNALYQVSFASTDGITVDVTIDGASYDQSQGCTFLLTLDGDGGDDNAPMQVQQVALDLSGVDAGDVEASIPSLAEQSEEFLAFAQGIATAAQGGGSGSDDGNA